MRQIRRHLPARCLSSVDYEMGELFTHAQSTLWLVGYSELAKAILNDVKPHNALAATILGIPYDEFNRRYKDKSDPGYRQASDTRQACKPANFGFPGRLGSVKLVHQQRKQGPDTPHPTGPTMIELEDGAEVPGYKGLRFCLLMNYARRCGEVKITEFNRRTFSPTCKHCILAAEDLKKGWLRQWPENREYFEHIKKMEEGGGLIEQHVSKRLRTPSPREAGLGNSLANGYFQALLADATKEAACQVSYECYVANDNNPALYGSRMVLFAHDELISEHDEPIAHEAAHRISEIMVETLRRYVPDLAPKVAAEPALMRQWLKGAVPVVHRDRLVPWTEDHNPKKCAECADQSARDAARKRAA